MGKGEQQWSYLHASKSILEHVDLVVPDKIAAISSSHPHPKDTVFLFCDSLLLLIQFCLCGLGLHPKRLSAKHTACDLEP